MSMCNFVRLDDFVAALLHVFLIVSCAFGMGRVRVKTMREKIEGFDHSGHAAGIRLVQNSVWKLVCIKLNKTTTGWLRRLSAKVRDGVRERNLAFRELGDSGILRIRYRNCISLPQYSD